MKKQFEGFCEDPLMEGSVSSRVAWRFRVYACPFNRERVSSFCNHEEASGTVFYVGSFAGRREKTSAPKNSPYIRFAYVAAFDCFKL